MVRKHLKPSGDEVREIAAERVLRHERKSLSDIVPLKKRNVVSFEEESQSKKFSVRSEEEEEVADEEGQMNDETIFQGEAERIKVSYKKWLFIALVIVFAGAGFIAIYVLPKADIKISLRTSTSQFNGDVSAMISGGDIPAQRFSQPPKNLELPLAATGKKLIQSKAKGTIRIYNAYSSESQTLVATTRFLSPDGKLFRLDSAVTVPGAKISDGKIIPSSIDAAVSADKIGPEYNIPPVQKLTIPGLKGSPKYEAFYGVSDAPMKGGVNGVQSYPKSEDIAAAKKNAEKAIRDVLQGSFAVSVPSEFTVLDGSSRFQITRSEPVPTSDSNGNYIYFVEAKEDRMAVRSSDILNLMISKAVAEKAVTEPGADFDAKKTDLKFDYKSSNIGKDGTLKGVTLSVVFKGDFVRKIDVNDLRGKIAGKNENDLKTLILSVPGIESAKIALWPFWVKTVPVSIGKITVSA